ncbi:hypothetical protein EVAR_62970_1 [Eumeta japonica]|uniref:Mariner Mos1 transposase n=1 Tax=Eumeta variegata TaxID=151549 RepID=A0A4C1ZCC6_EUMVA|nr:hypothetical protein EVAR_62970_1 [Eumeta japonica]
MTCEMFLKISLGRKENFISRIVAFDETWIRQWDPEIKQESLQWIFNGKRPPRKFKIGQPASKLRATIFWDVQGILVTDYLPKKTTMTAEYYANLLYQLCESIKEKANLEKGF